MRGSTGRATLVAAAFAAMLAAAATALAATGDLTPEGCVDDNDTGGDTCAQSVDGLDGARSAALSPDGRTLYVAAENDDAIAWFTRDLGSGALTPAGCIEDSDAGQGPDNCTGGAEGLDGPASVTVSPDGESVYAGSALDQAVVRFDRNTTTGALTPQGCIDDNDTGPDTCAQSTDGLNLVRAVTVSPDGTSVYAGSINDDAIVRFTRAPGGALTPQDCIDDNDTGPDICAQSADGLDSVNSFAISADGTSLYTGAGNDDAIALFTRAAGGALTPQGCIDDNETGGEPCAQSTDGLEQARSVTLTSDGSSLYAAGAADAAVVRFDRGAGVALTPQGCVDDNDTGDDGCAQSTDGLGDVDAVIPSPDGLSVYANSSDDDAVVVFDRSPNPGALTPRGCIEDNDPPSGPDACVQSADGLAATVTLAISPDGSSLYSGSVGDDAVTIFSREPSSDPPPSGDNFPPDTGIRKGPKRKTPKRKAKFEFGGSEPGVTFECRLDVGSRQGSFEPCASPHKIKGLKRKTKYVFSVRAVDAAGNEDPTPADRRWKVTKKKKKN